MSKGRLYTVVQVLIALVWFLNGLYCKVLNLVPRHQEIVGEILGKEHARLFTLLIGASEILMAVWVLSRLQARICAIAQIAIIAAMNVLEFFLVPELLLWGRLNSLFAFMFICLIYWNEFILKPKIAPAKNA